MNNDEDKNQSTPADTEDYYETLASQEQTYLDEVEENLRTILTSDDPSLSRNSNENPRTARVSMNN